MDSVQPMRWLSVPITRFSTTQYSPCWNFLSRSSRLRHLRSCCSSRVRGEMNLGSSVVDKTSGNASCNWRRLSDSSLSFNSYRGILSVVWLLVNCFTWCRFLSTSSTARKASTSSAMNRKLRLLTWTAIDVRVATPTILTKWSSAGFFTSKVQPIFFLWHTFVDNSKSNLSSITQLVDLE